ncbi:MULTISPECIES: hypothetical protein [Paenarthrobacter]|uniref:Uncharacterized protein n=1 Tax=Paenarthrobacter ureafaciens TaxID=37931 RepID=A0AAX3EI75_PAEUR|nr:MULTISPECIES: hypothetical protein [Paenarthrobacter]MDO5865987.1 hypothetical protein [Paenarthrobacter sp. SD-2]MDO5877082.1 hypothetical protein [Paenarthrobacter sp. SD-1]UYV92284.1 hypothetical protein NL395_17445 [Paenarthrobacter ureafaciens]UYV96819.1 hypothetical protein NL394_17475 [Paenarthrobacter ureafaciens]WIV32181.1 hypothetical protein QN084_06110 [Paenarthrobacter sp. R1]
MSKHTFSVLTSDLRRDPSILQGIEQELGARPGYVTSVTITEHGPVTTVTAVAA